jgi:GT2 family glycosyltransferase
MASLSVVIVTHDSRDAVSRSLPALVEQLRDGDALIVVDNASTDGTPAAVRALAADAFVVETGANLGFAAACNRGAEAAKGELLCLLNPDAVPQDGWREAIERPLVDGRGWSAWQALVTADDGRSVNTRGGVVHFTGIAWAGGAGEPMGQTEPGVRGGSHSSGAVADPGFVSGACLAIPRRAYLDAGGMPEEFFLYHEDVDLSLRLRLAGGEIGVEPDARVDHEYEFAKGAAKWRYLERNRWATVVRTYPAALLAVLAPALLLTELALVPIALAGGWLRQKLAAWGDTLGSLPRLWRERRAIQATRTIGAGEFATGLTADLDSAYLGAAGRSRLIRAGLRAYWSLALALLGARR